MLKGIRPVISRDLIHSYAAMLAPRSREGFGGYHVEMPSVFHLPPHHEDARSSERVQNSEKTFQKQYDCEGCHRGHGIGEL
jgi:hypothetical protein